VYVFSRKSSQFHDNNRVTSFLKVAKFSDGLSFVNAFKAEEESQKATTTSSPLPSDQKWQIWYWKSHVKNGKKNGNWQDFLRMKSSFTTREQFWQ